MKGWVLLALLLPASCIASDIHARLGADGRLVISTAPQPGSRPFQPLARAAQVAPQHRSPGPAVPPGLLPLFERTAAETGVDARLLMAVARHESGFDPRAVSRVGAVGLMQLMPATARRFGVSDRFNVTENLRGGARYLAWLLKHHGHDLSLTLAAYNAGEGAVQRHGNRVPPYPETQAYVRTVLSTYQRGLAQKSPGENTTLLMSE